MVRKREEVRGPCLVLSCCTVGGMRLDALRECGAHDAVLAMHILRTLTAQRDVPTVDCKCSMGGGWKSRDRVG